eukprot:5412016-Amphidinium_carterae.1
MPHHIARVLTSLAGAIAGTLAGFESLADLHAGPGQSASYSERLFPNPAMNSIPPCSGPGNTLTQCKFETIGKPIAQMQFLMNLTRKIQHTDGRHFKT